MNMRAEDPALKLGKRFVSPLLCAAGLVSIALLAVASHAAETLASSGNRLASLPLNIAEAASEVVPGVWLSHIESAGSESARFTLSTPPLAQGDADLVATHIAAAGLPTLLRPASPAAPEDQISRFILTTGNYASRELAERARSRLDATGSVLGVINEQETAGYDTGPLALSVLRIDPEQFTGSVLAHPAADQVGERGLVTAAARRLNAIAAVNGGFFAWKPAVGRPGDPAGLLVLDGDLVSEGVSGRPALLIDASGERLVFDVLRDVRSASVLKMGGDRWNVTGVNRSPGRVLNCGFDGEKGPVAASHDVVCSRTAELIVYDHHASEGLLTESGVVMLLNGDGVVVACEAQAPTALRRGEIAVHATGSFAPVLTDSCVPGERARVEHELTAESVSVPLHAGLYLTGGGPTLVHDALSGSAHHVHEGWSAYAPITGDVRPTTDEDDAIDAGKSDEFERHAFYYGWIGRRHPRTAAGVTSRGELIFVVVYGRRENYSTGLAVSELSEVLKGLGAVRAVNLDGGGSSAMVFRGELTGRPSDATGERSVGDVLLILDESERVGAVPN